MIEQFKVKPSGLVTAYIAIIHLFALICVLGFDIPNYLRTVGVFALLVSLLWSIKQWLCQQQYLIKYEGLYQCWSISVDAQEWRRYESVRVAYLNDAFVWIVLSSPGVPQKARLIGVDSMENERFLQLRRCILCPDMFKR
ncbi:MAG: protein YgfX [Gammaproteobacteria bacterium]